MCDFMSASKWAAKGHVHTSDEAVLDEAFAKMLKLAFSPESSSVLW